MCILNMCQNFFFNSFFEFSSIYMCELSYLHILYIHRLYIGMTRLWLNRYSSHFQSLQVDLYNNLETQCVLRKWSLKVKTIHTYKLVVTILIMSSSIKNNVLIILLLHLGVASSLCRTVQFDTTGTYLTFLTLNLKSQFKMSTYFVTP